nr:Chain A, MP1 [unidentified]
RCCHPQCGAAYSCRK